MFNIPFSKNYLGLLGEKSQSFIAFFSSFSSLSLSPLLNFQYDFIQNVRWTIAKWEKNDSNDKEWDYNEQA